MKPAVPWSVKGVEPEAREAAKRAARGSGMTLGAWLSRKIREAEAPDDVEAPDRRRGKPKGPGSATDLEQESMPYGRHPQQAQTPPGDYGYAPYGADVSAVAPSLDALRRHLQDSESRSERTFNQISNALEAVLSKLDEAGERRQRRHSDDTSESLRAINSALSDVTLRLASVERRSEAGGGLTQLERSIADVERNVDKLRDRGESRDTRRMDAVRGLERAVSELAQRHDTQTQNQADALRRTEQSVVEQREKSVTRAAEVQSNFEDMRGKVTDIIGQLDTLRGTVSQAATKDDMVAMERRMAEAAKSTSDETRKALRAELVERLDAAETRSAEAITAIAKDVLETREAVGENPDISAFKEELTGQLNDIVARLEVLNGEVESRFEHFAEEAQIDIDALRQDLAVLTEAKREPANTAHPAATVSSTAPQAQSATQQADAEPDPRSEPVERPAAPARPTARPARPVRNERPDRPGRSRQRRENRRPRFWVWLVTLIFVGIGVAALSNQIWPSSESGTAAVRPPTQIQETPLPTPDRQRSDATQFESELPAVAALERMPTMTLDTTPDRNDAPPQATQPQATSETERTALATSALEPSPRTAVADQLPATSVQSEPALPQPAEIYAEALRLLEAGTSSGDLAAARRLRTAADQGLVIAQYRLATLYETGRGVPQDMSLARDWYIQAAEGGNLRAMHNLANLYAEGLVDGERNYTEATRWFAEAASFGILDSQFNLGVIFERGIGVRADTRQAYLWYSIAAAGGDTDAVARRDQVAAQIEDDIRSQIDSAVRDWQPRTANPEANGRLSISQPLGASPNEVALAQEFLNRLGFTAGPPDGIMGPRTAEAIRLFEQRVGLSVTGRVSTALLSRLEAAVSAN